MKFARVILIASFVICFASFAVAWRSGQSGGGGTNALASPTPFQGFSNTPSGSHCSGNFAAGTGVCYLYEFGDNSPNPFNDTAYFIDLHAPAGTVGLGIVQIREGPNYGPNDTSDQLLFQEFDIGNGPEVFVSLWSDPNFVQNPDYRGQFANENLGPCFLEENGVCNPGLAVWAPGGIGTNNTYWVYSEGTPEPGTLVLLGSGLLGAVGIARRKLIH